jgi:hypothetical protein
MTENRLTHPADHGRMDLRMFERAEGAHMADRTYATRANDMAGNARVRGFQPCVAWSDLAAWSPIALGMTQATKHGRPRRPEVSHP